MWQNHKYAMWRSHKYEGEGQLYQTSCYQTRTADKTATSSLFCVSAFKTLAVRHVPDNSVRFRGGGVRGLSTHQLMRVERSWFSLRSDFWPFDLLSHTKTMKPDSFFISTSPKSWNPNFQEPIILGLLIAGDLLCKWSCFRRECETGELWFWERQSEHRIDTTYAKKLSVYLLKSIQIPGNETVYYFLCWYIHVNYN